MTDDEMIDGLRRQGRQVITEAVRVAGVAVLEQKFAELEERLALVVRVRQGHEEAH